VQVSGADFAGGLRPAAGLHNPAPIASEGSAGARRSGTDEDPPPHVLVAFDLREQKISEVSPRYPRKAAERELLAGAIGVSSRTVGEGGRIHQRPLQPALTEDVFARCLVGVCLSGCFR
jgi:hypothetical protein